MGPRLVRTSCLQLAPLSGLQRLGVLPLAGVDISTFSGRLAHLALRDCCALPEGTSRLTALESFAWENQAEAGGTAAEAGKLSAAAADVALSCLTRLTFLSLMMTLESSAAGAAQLPPSLSGPGRLHSASLLAIPPGATPLPASGPYLTSLRCLLVGAPTAAASVPALSAMPHLEWPSVTVPGVALALEGYHVSARVAAEAVHWVLLG